MDRITQFVAAIDGPFMVIATLVVLAAGLVAFLRHIARGDGAWVGLKKLLSILFSNLP